MSKKTNSINIHVPTVKDLFIQQVHELWDTHEHEFTGVAKECEAQRVKVSFGVDLDYSGAKTLVETQISFSQVTKDKRSAALEDPAQMRLIDDKPGEEAD